MLPFLSTLSFCGIGVGPAAVFSQPEDVSACAGGIVHLSAGAGGSSPVALQWRKDGLNIQGATSGVLTLDPVDALSAGTYDIVVTNSEGTATSDAAVVAVAECGSPTATASGCRALTLAQSEAGLTTPVAFRVSSSQIPCLSSYVDLDGKVVDEPAFHDAADWVDTLVVGPEIVPSTEYELRMDFGSALDPRLTPPTTVTTGPWGDVAGENVDGVWGVPDGAITIGDALAGIACFVNAPGAPRPERCDIHPATPDGAIKIIDVLQIIAGFQGLPYPFPPPGCP